MSSPVMEAIESVGVEDLRSKVVSSIYTCIHMTMKPQDKDFVSTAKKKTGVMSRSRKMENFIHLLTTIIKSHLYFTLKKRL